MSASLIGRFESSTFRLLRRRYQGDTLILETRFETDQGSARVIDFMPPRSGNSQLVRMIVGESGTVNMCMELAVRFGYGARVPLINRQEDGALRVIAGADQVVLRTAVQVSVKDNSIVGDFAVQPGETVAFTLTYAPSHLPPPDPVEARDAFAAAKRFWTDWAGKAPTGGIVAAPTTSLPETLGGIRNWDYRFCWLRDATLSLLALMNAGYYEEASAWREWLLRAVAGVPPQAQIMYSITGENRLTEWEVGWLPGRRQPPAPVLWRAEQGGKIGVRIEPRPAHPVHRTVVAHQRRRDIASVNAERRILLPPARDDALPRLRRAELGMLQPAQQGIVESRRRLNLW
jgi:GH15 family glucan-1,4-alpha-glucosidase